MYADLELFLLGLQMDDILPLFKKHSVSLTVLFTMTENDLKEVIRMTCTFIGCHRKMHEYVLPWIQV